MSDATSETEMDSPATQRQLSAATEQLRGETEQLRNELRASTEQLRASTEQLRSELRGTETRLRDEIRDTAASIRGMEESVLARVTALLDPDRDLPRRMIDAEARLDALEQRPTPRRPARRRSG